MSLAGRHAEWLLRLAAAPGIDARAGGPPPEGTGPGVIRREQAAVRQSPYSRGSDRARRAGQREARDPVDAGKRPEGAPPQTVHGDHDERSRPAGGRESPRPAVRSRRTESALGRGHDRVCHRLERQALSRRRPRPVLAVCGRLGRERRQRSPPDHQGAGDGTERRCPEIGLLHHSDQGCTYASADYQALLDARGIVCSMSRRGNCHDNAVMESFFSTVKSELADRFDTYGDAKMELFDYVEVFYNQRRRHSTLGQISPAAFERRANEEGVDPMENRQGRGFPQAPHPLSFSMRKEQTTKNDQLNETVHQTGSSPTSVLGCLTRDERDRDRELFDLPPKEVSQ